MIGISVAMLALGVGNTVVGNFMAYYVENVIHVGIGGGGAIASLTPIAALATAPFIGRLFDRSGDAKRLLLASGALMAFGVGIAFFGTIYLSILSALLVGLAAGAGFTIGISAARATNSIYPEYETLTVSWVNGFSMFGDFFPPLLFSSLVIRYGYSLAGLCLAGLTFVLTTPLLFLRVSRLERVSDS
jgi:MFS family permease